MAPVVTRMDRGHELPAAECRQCTTEPLRRSVRGDTSLSDRPEDAAFITADVQLPGGVLDAHQAGRLVFFVGAGASVAEPSGLPLFGGLAEELADLASGRDKSSDGSARGAAPISSSAILSGQTDIMCIIGDSPIAMTTARESPESAPG